MHSDSGISPDARWIGGTDHGRFKDTVPPAPYLRHAFTLDHKPGIAVARVAAPGWHELYVNGRKADDRVLSPTVTQFDRHVSVVEYDLSALLRSGKNAVAVVLGNGWYNCHTPDVWQFHDAPWRDSPKLLCDIVVDGAVRAVSGRHWKTRTGPIVFDALRNGERYDARLEIPGFADADLDDSDWKAPVLCTPPAGVPVAETLEPCKVMRRYPAVATHWLNPAIMIYDFGTNLTGWCELTVQGPPGAEVELRYGELVRDNFELETGYIDKFVKGGAFQEDRYICRGDGAPEVWEPRFTYHGFRYVQITRHHPDIEVVNLEACFVHNAFDAVGAVESSDPTLNRLQEITRQSYLSNFTGIPTDCPHREKNGWTGDAQLAMETGLWNFDARKAYRHFLGVFADGQRASGQLSGIAPTGGWGFNWGSGPAWDSLLFEGPHQLLRFYGDDGAAREHYDAMRRYLDYCAMMEDDGIVSFGLGDWCHFDHTRQCPPEVTSTGYYHLDALRLSRFAERFDRGDDADDYARRARRIRESFLRRFDRNDGSYADGSWTATGAALYFGLSAHPARDAAWLVDRVRANRHKVDFGILGAKYIPRVLADHGYARDAFLLLTQPSFPGWGFWVASGATTLWEHWNGRASRNHIMYGDVSAWMYQYLGGIVPDMEHPGFRHFGLKPCFVPGLEHFAADYRSVAGPIRSAWRREEEGVIVYEARIPEGCTADLTLPDHVEHGVKGHVSRKIAVPS